MKMIEVIFFKVGSCGSCNVAQKIFMDVANRINAYFGEQAIDLKIHDMEEEEGYRLATQLNVSSAPKFVIHGEEYVGEITEEGLLEMIAKKMGMKKHDLECLRRSLKDYGEKERGATYTVSPIGVVRVEADDDEVSKNGDGLRGMIEVYDTYAKGLEGIDGFSHIIVFSFLNKVTPEERRILMVRPKWLRETAPDPNDVPLVGVFSTHSPDRPNPIGVTVVKLINRNGNRLCVDGLDLFDGTPVIDIKPYTIDRIEKGLRFPDWYNEMMSRLKEKQGNGSLP